MFRALDGGWPSSETHITGDLAAFGEYLLDHPAPPWIKGAADYAEGSASRRRDSAKPSIPLDELSRTAYLGAAAITTILSESSQKTFRPPFNALPELVPYQSFRQDAIRRTKPFWEVNKLQDLPVPYEFEQIFRGWAALEVTVTGEQAEPQLLRNWTVVSTEYPPEMGNL